MTRWLVRSRWARRGLALFAVVALAALPLLQVTTVLAHPLGNFTVNRYARIEVYKDRLQVHYVIDMAEIPTFQAMPSIDSDKDGVASSTELATYAARSAETYREAFTLSAGDDQLETAALESSAQLVDGQGGLKITRVVVVYDAPLPAGSNGKELAVRFEDRNLTNSQGWKEIVVRGSEGAQVTVDPRLTMELSNALLAYPAQTLASAPNMRRAEFAFVAGTGTGAPSVRAVETAPEARFGGGFAGVFEDLLGQEQSVGFILLSLAVAFAFGAQHAFGPGHGKTMVAAYLVGSKGTPKQAVVLGITVTATHTSTVYLLGFVTLVAAAYVTPEKLYLWMGVASGLLVVLFGATLFAGRLIGLRRGAKDGGEHRHGVFGRAHTHAPAEHAGEHDHSHGHGEHGHEPQPVSALEPGGHHQATGNSQVTSRSLLSLGVIGGLLPCPSAVVVMVAAISQGQVLLGMLLIVAFSLGLAGVLTAIGVSLVVGRKIPARQRRLLETRAVQRLVTAMPVISALVVMLVGIGITYQALTV